MSMTGLLQAFLDAVLKQLMPPSGYEERGECYLRIRCPPENPVNYPQLKLRLCLRGFRVNSIDSSAKKLLQDPWLMHRFLFH